MTISASKQQSAIAALIEFVPQVSRSTNNTVITQKKICDPTELPAYLRPQRIKFSHQLHVAQDYALKHVVIARFLNISSQVCLWILISMNKYTPLIGMSTRPSDLSAVDPLEQLGHSRLAGNFSIQKGTHRGSASG